MSDPTQTTTLSAFQAAMETVTEVYGPITARERDIATTAARTAFYRAHREISELIKERAENAER